MRVKLLTSHADQELYAANHEWRHKIASHGGGLRPHLDPSRDHIRGSDHPRVTLVQYGDYQSTACVTAAGELARLRPSFDGELRFAFRGVNGTPTFFIDEGRLDWDFDIETLKSALEHPSRTE